MAEACYIPDFLPGSFKGAPFEAVSAGSEHGRRGAEGEFPFGEETAYADLGRKIRTYSIKARFVRNSHVADAASLIAACESTGPGLLVHPTRGPVQAACRSIKVEDEIINGAGETIVDMDFVEAADWGGGFNIGGGALDALDIGGVLGAAADFLGGALDFVAAPFFEVAAIAADVADIVGAVQSAFGAVLDPTSSPAEWMLHRSLGQVAANPRQQSGASIIAAIQAGLEGVDISAKTFEKRDAAFRKVARAASRTARLGGASGKMQNALFAATRVSAAAHIARSALQQRTETLDAAIRLADQVETMLREEQAFARSACDIPLEMAIDRIANETRAKLLNRAYTLPALIKYDFGGGLWHVIAAHEIYGDARKARRLEASNPHHPVWSMGPEIMAGV